MSDNLKSVKNKIKNFEDRYRNENYIRHDPQGHQIAYLWEVISSLTQEIEALKYRLANPQQDR